MAFYPINRTPIGHYHEGVRVQGLTESQKDAIRRDRQTMSGADVARKHSITRQRVHQIMGEPPNEAKRAAEIEMGLEPYTEPEPEPETEPGPVSNRIVLFRPKRLKKLEDLALQQAIRREPMNYHAIARKYGITWTVVRKIRSVAI
jgi:hypothetical protein